jgi:hypothetical protein
VITIGKPVMAREAPPGPVAGDTEVPPSLMGVVSADLALPCCQRAEMLDILQDYGADPDSERACEPVRLTGYADYEHPAG